MHESRKSFRKLFGRRFWLCFSILLKVASVICDGAFDKPFLKKLSVKCVQFDPYSLIGIDGAWEVSPVLFFVCI